MHSVVSHRPILNALLTALVGLALTGCVSSGYRLAPKTTPPAVPLGWSSGTSPVNATLQHVIVYQGPGSWKAEAYWDEYVVTLRNTGAAPQTVTRALLTDFRSSAVLAGDQPWALEKQSRDITRRITSTMGDIVRLGTGAYLQFATGVAGIFGGATVISMVPGASVSMGTVMGAVTVLPFAVVGATVYRNVSNKHAIEAEFTRRRLAFPVTLAPGQEITGSLFFPVSPGPQRLQVHLEGQAMIDAIELPLGRLADLHLQAPTTGENDPVPMRVIRRDGRRYTSIEVDMSVPGGVIALDGRDSRPAPATIEVEIDEAGRIIEGLSIAGSARASRLDPLPLSGYLVLTEGSIPPAKVEFTRTVLRKVPYVLPASGARNAP